MPDALNFGIAII